MKKTLTLLTVLTISTFLNAQNLQSVSIFPINPTSADQIKIIGDLMFTSGGCDMLSSNHSISGNQIEVEVKHCTGMLTFICHATDTIDIGTLPPGNYTLTFTALTGSFDFSGNCSNFLSGGQQSLQFQVSGSTSINDYESKQPQLFYDNSRDQLIVRGNPSGCRLQLIDLLGKQYFNGPASEGPLQVKGTLHKGIYVFSFKYPDGEVRGGRLFIQ